jgi:hypothetical protein
MTATVTSWKHLPAPAQREDLHFEALFTMEEGEQLMKGVVPEVMEDKWFIYYSDGWLRFHRSWTGAFIYALRLEPASGGVRVVESWVSRDPSQYQGVDTDYDRLLVRCLIDALLLQKRDVVFPLPRKMRDAPPGLAQHSAVGRAYPEDVPETLAAKVVKTGCLMLVAIGIAHAAWVLIAGEYELAEFGVNALLRGWHARVPAALELAMFVWLGVATWKWRAS